MTRIIFRTLVLASTALTIVACGFEHSRSITAPTTTSSASSGSGGGTGTPTTNGAPSLLGGWVSHQVDLPSKDSCGNFQYQIASQTSTSIAGTFTATCGNGMVITASANGQLNGNNVNITINGSGSMPGLPNCPFSVTGVGSIEENGNALRIPYSGTTCLGPVHGTETLRRPTPASTPAPEPPPPPPPPPPPAPSGPSDGLDLHGATITGGSPSNVADWPITTKLDAMDFGGNGVRVDFSKKDGPGRWPDVTPPGWDGPIQYTLWMVVNIGGHWYTSGGVEYWYGLDRQGGPANLFAYNWYYSAAVWGPLANHQPGNGEQVGFFLTAGDARAKDVRAVTERSNVVVVPFPTNGGYFAFVNGKVR